MGPPPTAWQRPLPGARGRGVQAGLRLGQRFLPSVRGRGGLASLQIGRRALRSTQWRGGWASLQYGLVAMASALAHGSLGPGIGRRGLNSKVHA